MLKNALLGCLTIVSLFAEAQTPNVHFYFNANFKDTAMNKIQGNAYGNPSFGTDIKGMANSACNFDGIDDYIDLGTTATLKPTSNLTMALWAHSDNWNGFSNSPTLAGNTENGGYGIMINNSTQTIDAKVFRKNAFGVATYSLSKLNPGWHHFAVTYNAGSTALFVDGKPVDTDFVSGNPLIYYIPLNNNFIVGDEASSGSVPEGKKFKGKIDDLRFYNTYLNESQMQTLYSSTSAALFSSLTTKTGNFISPNPAQNTLFIAFEESPTEATQLFIYNMVGEQMASMPVTSQAGRVSLNRPDHLTTGTYYAVLQQNNKIVARQLLVLE